MISPEKEKELREVQDLAIENAIAEMSAAGDLTIETKQDRGDRYWLTKMAGQSFQVATRIEQFLILRNREPDSPEEDETEYAAATRLIGRARAEVGTIMERLKKNTSRRNE